MGQGTFIATRNNKKTSIFNIKANYITIITFTPGRGDPLVTLTVSASCLKPHSKNSISIREK